MSLLSVLVPASFAASEGEYVSLAGERVEPGARVSGVASFIASGSAIVSGLEGLEDGRVCIDYEGNLHQSMNTWCEQVLHAAGRHTTKYPTTARAWAQASDLVEIGVYETETRQLSLSEPALAAAWTGIEAGELTRQARLGVIENEMRSIMRNRAAFSDPRVMMRAQSLAAEQAALGG